MDVPELRRLVLGRETQVPDTQLQGTDAKDFAGRGVGRCRHVGLLATACTLWAEMPASGVELGGGTKLVVMATCRRLLLKSKAEASRVSPATMQATATTSATGKGAPVAMDASEQ